MTETTKNKKSKFDRRVWKRERAETLRSQGYVELKTYIPGDAHKALKKLQTELARLCPQMRNNRDLATTVAIRLAAMCVEDETLVQRAAAGQV